MFVRWFTFSFHPLGFVCAQFGVRARFPPSEDETCCRSLLFTLTTKKRCSEKSLLRRVDCSHVTASCQRRLFTDFDCHLHVSLSDSLLVRTAVYYMYFLVNSQHEASSYFYRSEAAKELKYECDYFSISAPKYFCREGKRLVKIVLINIQTSSITLWCVTVIFFSYSIKWRSICLCIYCDICELYLTTRWIIRSKKCER